MVVPKELEKERERLRSLESYSILDTLPEEDFDNLTAIAAEICNTHISLVSLIDDKRQWFKSNHGMDARETPKEYAFCAHALHEPHEVFMIEDARLDERFHDNPLVTGEPHVIFYAGVPLNDLDGLPLGTLCVIDDQPKKLNEQQLKSLRALGQQVMNLLELRKNKRAVEQQNQLLMAHSEALEKFAKLAVNDMRSPVGQITGNSLMLMKNYESQLSPKAIGHLEMINKSADQLGDLITGMLEYDNCLRGSYSRKTNLSFDELMEQLEAQFESGANLSLRWSSKTEVLQMVPGALRTILTKLIENTCQHSDKDLIRACISLEESEEEYLFELRDNGPGIRAEDHKLIFDPLETGSEANGRGTAGSGFGLAIVKRIVEAQGGTLAISAQESEGTMVSFTIRK